LSNEHLGLAKKFKVNPSSCGGDGNLYEQKLVLTAQSQQYGDGSVIHVLLESDSNGEPQRIVGYISFVANGIDVPSGGDKIDSLPAIEIKTMAVDRDFERQGIGTLLLDYSIHVAIALRQNFIGVDFIITCAAESSVGFYSKYKKQPFVKLDDFFGNADMDDAPENDLDIPNNIPMILTLPK